MDENRRKIILWAIVAILVIAIVVVVVLSLSQKNQTSSTVSPTPTAIPYAGYTPPANTSGIDYTGPTNGATTQISGTSPTALTSKTQVSTNNSATPTAKATPDAISQDPILSRIPRSAIVAVTPYPGSGPYDWTQESKYLVDGSKIPSSTAQKQTLCEQAGLSDNWDNAVEKFACDSVNFFGTTVVDMLSQINCSLYISALQVNIDSKITGQFENGFCKVEQR